MPRRPFVPPTPPQRSITPPIAPQIATQRPIMAAGVSITTAKFLAVVLPLGTLLYAINL
jgi:hypothetical protein